MTKVYKNKSSATRAAKAAASKAPDGATFTVDTTPFGYVVIQHAPELPAAEAPSPLEDTVALETLGLYGTGSDEATAECPHCGANHLSNGYQTADNMAADGQHDAAHEYICLGCGGEWGPALNPFAAAFAAAGGHQPRSICKALRAVATDWQGSRKSFLQGAEEVGLNTANAAAEWQVARKK